MYKGVKDVNESGNRTIGAAASDQSQRRTLFAVAQRLITIVLIVTLIGGVVGYVARDRTIVTQLLMFVPLAPVGLVAFVWMLIQRRTRARRRIAVLSIAISGCVIGAAEMIGWRDVARIPDDAPRLKMIQWNVLWGGMKAERDWPKAAQRIRACAPHFVVLSESADKHRVKELCDSLGTNWQYALWHNEPHQRYTFNLAILAPAPIAVEQRISIPTGLAMIVQIDLQPTPIRVLIVDGLSAPGLSRTARTREVARLLKDEAAAGNPIDVVAGDFNTPARSVGFDEIEDAAEGYALASRHSGGWRATWPAPLPLWDIDHVLISRRHPITSVDLFTESGFDHRGQVVTFALNAAKTDHR